MAKQSRDLSALSELMSALVKSQSHFSENLSKAATDSTTSTQDFIKSFLATTRTQVSAQAANQHQFLVEAFLPKFQAIAAALHQQGHAVQQLQTTLMVSTWGLVRLETKSRRILPLTYVKKYDMT